MTSGALRPALFAMSMALLAVPMGQSQLDNPVGSTPTTLYFHIFDTYNAFPINTQPMDAAFFEVSGVNVPTLPAEGYDFNTVYGFLTSGPVEYDFIENGRPRFHPERGIASDVLIDPTVPSVVYLYIDVRDVFSSDTFGLGLPQALPAMTFRFAMRAGNQVALAEDLEDGALIMQGERTVHLVDGHVVPANGAVPPTGPDGNDVLVPDEAGVIELAIPIDLAQERIPKADGFHVRLDWYQALGGAMQEDEFAEGWMRLVLDQDHLPRLEMAVLNPVYIEFIHPQVAAGTLLIHAGVNSPWGTYDVDVANLTLAIDGPARPQALAQVVTQNAHVHGLHDQAAEVTWLWPFREEDAPSGDYAIQLQVPNLAGNAQAVGQASFTVEGRRAYGFDESGNEVAAAAEGPAQESPGVPPALLAAALMAVALAWRRR